MHQLDHHPLRTLGAMLALAFVLFMLSGIPTIRDATSGGWLVVGDICWFGFLLTALAFVVTGVVVLVRRLGHRRTA